MRGHRRRLVLGLLCTAQFVLVLDVTIVAVALPSVRERLGFSLSGLQWVISAYVLAFAGLLLLGGRAADLWGRRRLFMVGLATFAGASAWCGLARASWELVAARAVQGAGAAVVTPAALSLLTTTFAEGAWRERALGVWTAAAAGGGATGFLLGGVMTQTLGWRAVFLVNVPVGAAGLLLAPVLLAEERITSAARLDLPGAATLTGAMSSLVYALSRVERGGPGAAGTWLALDAAVLLGVAFVVRERRAANPLIPLDALRHRGLVGASLVALLLTGVTTPAALFSVLYLQDVLGYPPALAGVTVAPISVAVVAGSLVGSRLIGAGRLGADRTMAAGLLGVALGAGGLATMAASGGLPPTMVAGFVLSGLGLGGRLGRLHRQGHRRGPAGAAGPGLRRAQYRRPGRHRVGPGGAGHGRLGADRRAHPAGCAAVGGGGGRRLPLGDPERSPGRRGRRRRARRRRPAPPRAPRSRYGTPGRTMPVS
jgi:predicted MFS family arabinose efflux permease